MAVYMDNQSTTRVDPRVLDAMLPFFDQQFGNAASITHVFGHAAHEAVENCRAGIAAHLGVTGPEVIFTSGATESNNLAITGLMERARAKGWGRHIVSVQSEHRAVLDPLKRLEDRGGEVTLLPVTPNDQPNAGQLDVERLIDSLRDDTVMVSVMWANNEIGVLHPMAELVAACHARGVKVHCDATQAVGKVAVRLDEIPIDLLSFSAHKIYGPKGIGALIVRKQRPRLRLAPQIHGGSHESGLRSGTLNVPGIVGLARALDLCCDSLSQETDKLRQWRNRLFDLVSSAVGDVQLNGPALDAPSIRLPQNLNMRFDGIDGEALMLQMPEVAVSSGSACTAADPQPSHVLLALGLSVDEARSSLRYGLGRFSTSDDVELVAAETIRAVQTLRRLG